MKLIYLFPVLLILVGGLACGGGGGGNSLPFFGGVYRASFAITENTCQFEQSSYDDTLTVNQIEQELVADTRLGHYAGSPTGEDSFAVTRTYKLTCISRSTGAENPSSTTSVTDTYIVTNITAKSALITNTVSFGNCSGNIDYDSTCHWTATGSAILSR